MQTAKLEQLCSIKGGGTPSRKNESYYKGTIPWATVKDFTKTRISETKEYISREGLENSAANLIPKGSILVVTRMGLGKVAIAEADVAINQDIKALFLEDESINAEYLFWFLFSKAKYFESVGTGATVKGIKLDVLKNLDVPLPPINQQKRIVDILKRAEGIVRLRREQLEKTRALIPALFIDMFGDPVTNPKGWDIKPFEKVVNVNPRLPQDQRPSDDTTVSFVPMAAVDQNLGTITKSEEKSYKDVSRGFTNFQNYDVIFAKITPCMENGKSAIARNLINGLAFGSTEFHVFRPMENISTSEWIWAYVWRESFRRTCKLNFTGTAGQQRVPTRFLKSMEVPIPPVYRQKEFALELHKIHAVRDKKLQSLNAQEQLFAALLHRAFNGEV